METFETLRGAPAITRVTTLDNVPELLRVSEVATLLDVAKGTVYAMVARGDLPVVKAGRLHRIPRAALVALVGREVEK